MKNIIILFLVASAFTGCKKWLDVQPSDQIVDNELFSEALGYQHALNGIYIQAATQDLFGRNLSYGLNSSLGQDYAPGKMGTEQQLVQYYDKTHASSQALIDNIWSKGYNTIANCNKLLGEIEAVPESKFQQGRSERNMIIGEALAMRAMMHFEILRLYAPAPAKEPGGKYIPYVSNYPARLNPPVTTSQVLDQITADLEKAQSLVAENDTIVNKNALTGKLQVILTGLGNQTYGGPFYSYRMNRLNYVAIQGLLARVYLYAGNNIKAMHHARYLYDNYGPHGRLKYWEFTPEANTSGSSKYYKMANDLLLAFYDADLIANLNKSFQSRYRISSDADSWFPASDRDYRAGLLREFETDIVSEKGKITEKWMENPSTVAEIKRQNTIIPVLRLSEIYYIYSETLFRSGQVVEALDVLNQVRYARGKLTTFSQTDEEAFYQELLNEYRREFLTEGQTFFAYKRLQRNLMRGTQVITLDERFILPVPQNEQIF